MFVDLGEPVRPHSAKERWFILQSVTEHILLVGAGAIFWQWYPVSSFPFLHIVLYIVFGYLPIGLIFSVFVFVRTLKHVDRHNDEGSVGALSRSISLDIFRVHTGWDIIVISYRMSATYILLLGGILAQNSMLINMSIFGAIMHFVTVTVLAMFTLEKSKEIRS